MYKKTTSWLLINVNQLFIPELPAKYYIFLVNFSLVDIISRPVCFWVIEKKKEKEDDWNWVLCRIQSLEFCNKITKIPWHQFVSTALIPKLLLYSCQGIFGLTAEQCEKEMSLVHTFTEHTVCSNSLWLIFMDARK